MLIQVKSLMHDFNTEEKQVTIYFQKSSFLNNENQKNQELWGEYAMNFEWIN